MLIECTHRPPNYCFRVVWTNAHALKMYMLSGRALSKIADYLWYYVTIPCLAGLYIGYPTIAWEKEKNECARLYSRLYYVMESGARRAFPVVLRHWSLASRSRNTNYFVSREARDRDVIPQVTRIFLKSARRCDNIIQACPFILFFLSSNSWVAYGVPG